ncbi:MAG: PAS domain-containing sensor histidine kinase [Rhodospirillales bacterium]
MSGNGLHLFEDLRPLSGGSFADVFFSGVPDGIAFIDRAGFIVGCNPAFERIFGYGDGELNGQNVSILMAEPDRSHHSGYLRRFQTTGQRRIIGTGRQVTGLTKYGAPLPLNLSVGEAPGGFVGIVRSRSGTTLAEGEDEMAAMAEIANLAAETDTDMTAGVEWLLSRLADLFGASLAFVGHDDGQRLTLITGHKAGGLHLGASEGSIQSQDIAQTYARVLRDLPDLEPYFRPDTAADKTLTEGVGDIWRLTCRQFGGIRFSVAGEVFLMAFGSPLPRIEPLSEVERRLFRAIASACRNILARRAAERERALAQAAERAKATFMTMMNHEMRTPLNAVIGFSDLLSTLDDDDLSPERVRDYAGHIRDCGRHLLRVVEDILDLTRIQGGLLEVMLEPCDVGEALYGVATILSGAADKRAITLTPLPAPNLPRVKADPLRLRQVLVNLCSNGLKFTEPGGSVTLSAKPADQGVEIEVADTGIGMSQEEIAHAMAPFAQVDEKLCRRYEGAGLGLPITRKLVELHGGTFRIDSRKGEGTAVRVTLPVC